MQQFLRYDSEQEKKKLDQLDSIVKDTTRKAKTPSRDQFTPCVWWAAASAHCQPTSWATEARWGSALPLGCGQVAPACGTSHWVPAEHSGTSAGSSKTLYDFSLEHSVSILLFQRPKQVAKTVQTQRSGRHRGVNTGRPSE